MKSQHTKLTRPILLLAITACTFSLVAKAQPVLETGGTGPMPDEWIDKDTHHKVVRLTPKEGNNSSFYFHNYPFIEGSDKKGDRMVFYNTDKVHGRQIYSVNLKDRKVEQITQQSQPMHGEIVGRRSHNVYYQIKDSVFRTNADNLKTELVYVFPEDFKADITTLNADETLLAGTWGTGAEKEIFKANPEKKDYFNKIYEARLPRTLFTVNVNTGELKKIFTDSAWLNHVQFSPTDPSLLMFCHEGPWHKVDRIWTINVGTGSDIKLIHKRTMDMEIAGHEWFSADGKTIWFDNQKPRGATFFVTGTDLATGREESFQHKRDEWSVHYTSAPNGQTFAGDGGYPTSVAHSAEGHWIYLFTVQGEHFKSEKLVNLKHHDYKLEPNVHYSPDGKWLIFRANFEGHSDVYAVEI